MLRNWNTVERSYQPERVPNPTRREIAVEHTESALDLFLRYVPEDLVSQWALWTNHRIDIRRRKGSKVKTLLSQKKPVSTEEIYVFFAIILYMTVHREPTLRQYWSDRPDQPTHKVAGHMGRNRFVFIFRHLCMWQPADDDTKFSIWDKIRPWSSHIQTLNVQLWKPGFEISVDESMVRYQGRSRDTVIIKSKPIPQGFKLYSAAESGFMLTWAPHTKAGIQMDPLEYFPDELYQLSPTRAVVASLCLRLPPSPSGWRHIFVDNYFTSVNLFMYLHRRKIFATGTARVSNSGIDEQFASLKEFDDSKKRIPWGSVFASQGQQRVYSDVGKLKKPKSKPPGASQHLQTEENLTTPAPVNQLALKDCSLVVFLSTAYSGREDEIILTKKRPSESSTHAVTSRVPFGPNGTKELPFPLFATAYNYHMNGVDIADQLRADCAYQRRIRRGGFQALAFDFLLGVVVANIFLLQREAHCNAQQKYRTPQHQFRQQLFLQLIERFSRSSTGMGTTQPISTENHQIERATERGRCRACNSTFQRKILGQQPGKIVKFAPKTMFRCSTCKVHLCGKRTGRDCFEKYHIWVGKVARRLDN